MNKFFNNLITLEMANNHMGDVNHALQMVGEFNLIAKMFDEFQFAWKFQFRDIDTFIHKDYKNRMDVKYVKRFSETKLTNGEILKIKKFAEDKGFITMATAFDEPSVDLIEEMNFDIIKIASCSSTDWPLLNKIVETNKPIIISTAGVKLKDVDNIVSFLQHREKDFALMHCVGEYPTGEENLQLNQIDLFKNRYKNITVGFSTHENPNNYDTGAIAVAKGATILEKHVAVETNKYKPNAYSVQPWHLYNWLYEIRKALSMCGVKNERHEFSEKETTDLRTFKRGVFAKNDIQIDDIVSREEVYYAWPNCEKQILANDMSKYNKYTATQNIKAGEPVLTNSVTFKDTRDKIWDIVQDVKSFLKESNVAFPQKADLEISHHYGIDGFYKTGLTMITVINKEYCKKLIIMLPKQWHPEQYHKIKDETFIILYGSVSLYLNGERKKLNKGDVVTIEPGVKHFFRTVSGCVIEEISSTHFADDSYYTDATINNKKDRKTEITHWLD